MISSYYSLTTLATVGFGDFTPRSRNEMICCIFIEIVGLVFFSRIMGSFIQIIRSYDTKLGKNDKNSELQNWLSLLSRFTNNKALP